MESQPRRLWRKIGLQKNFLQGTSHSDESKGSLLEQSFANSETSSQSQAKNKSFMKTKMPFQQVQISKNHLAVNIHAKKSLNVSVQSCQTPINKLLGQYEAESKYTLWQQSDHDFAHNEAHSHMNAGINARRNSSGVSIVLSNSTINQNNMSLMIQNIGRQNNKKDTINQNNSSPKELFNVQDSVIISQERFGEVREIEYHAVGGDDQGEGMRIRLVGVDGEGKNVMERGQVNRQVRQLQQLMAIKQTRISSLECRLSTLLTQTLPNLSVKSSQLFHQHSSFKHFLTNSLTLFHKQLTFIIQNQFNQHIGQLSDQIGYLYSQNEQLISKIQGKQGMIRKLSQENGLVRKKLEQMEESSRLVIEQEKEVVVKLNNKIYSLEERLQDFQEIESQKESLCRRIVELQSQIIQLNNLSKQTLNKQINSMKGELSLKQNQIQRLQLELSDVKSSLSLKHQSLQRQIVKLSEITRSLEQQLHIIRKQKQSLQQMLRRQLQNQRKQMLIIKQQQKEMVFMRELLETLLGESLSQNSIQIVNKIEKQYSIKSYDFLNTLFAFIKEEIYHKTNTHPINNNNNSSNNISNNNQSNNSTPQSSSIKIQGFGTNNDSSKNLLRKTGYFGQVGGSRKLLNVRLDDIQKNYSRQILEQSQNGIEEQQYVRLKQFQSDNNMRQKNNLGYCHTRHESAQNKRLISTVSNSYVLPHALTQRYGSSRDIIEDLQIVKSGLRLQLGQNNQNHNHNNQEQQLMLSSSQYNNQHHHNNNKQCMNAFSSNPDYSFSEQNNLNQLSFYRKEFDFGDDQFINDQNQDQYKRHNLMGSFTDRNKSSSSNTLILNQNKKNSIIINSNNNNNLATVTMKTRNVVNNYGKQEEESSSLTSYYDRKSSFVGDGNKRTQRDNVIEKIRQRVRQKFGDSSRSRSKSRSKPQQQQQQQQQQQKQTSSISAYHASQQPNLKLNLTNLTNKQPAYNRLTSNQTSIISANQPTYNTSSISSIYPKTSRPSLYSNHHENDTGSRLLLTTTRKDENLSTKSNINVLGEFFERHKHPTVGQQQYHQVGKTQDQRIVSPSSRLVVRSPTNVRPRSPSNSSTVAGKVSNKYVHTGTGYGLMGNANKTLTLGSTVRSGFSRSTIQRPQFMGYSRKTPQSNTPHQNIPLATYQPKSPSYSITSRQHVSSFSKKY